MAESVASELFQQAQTVLNNSSIHALRELRVEQREGALVLSGRVGTFYHKQLAQELVRAVIDNCTLVNSINVDYVRAVHD